MNIYLSLGISLAATLIIEGLIAIPFRTPRLPVAAVNLLTNPPLVLLWLASGKNTPLLLSMELIAWLLEYGCYRLMRIKRPLLFSLSANGASFLFGIILGGII